MSQTQKTPVMNRKMPKGRAVHRKSRVKVPTISISPSTQKLLEENERIVSGYTGKRKKSLVEIVLSDR